MGGFTTATRAWLPVPADHMTKAVDRQANDPSSVLGHYRAMLAFRKAHPALIRGSITTLDAPDGVLAFVREGEGERIYCAFNMSERPVTVDLPRDLEVRPSGAPGIEDEPEQGALSLAPFGAYIGLVR
jgi:alpha-glucosidase